MTGLNLETFLRLLRADPGAWASLGVVAAILALMTWTRWGSKRALRKCLVLSVLAHVGLIVYGGSSPAFRRMLRLDESERRPDRPASPVRVTPWVDRDRPAPGVDGRPAPKVADWDRDLGPLAMAGPSRPAPSSAEVPAPTPVPSRSAPEPVAPEPVAPAVDSPALPPVEATPPVDSGKPDPPPSVAAGDPSEVAPTPADATSPAAPAGRDPSPAYPGASDLRARSRGADPAPARPGPRPGETASASPREPIELPQATPSPGVDVTPPPAGPARAPSTSGPVDDLPTTRPEDADPSAVAPDPGPAAAPSPSPPSPAPEASVRRAPRPDQAGSVTAPSRLADGSTPPAMARVTPSGPTVPAPPATSPARRSLSQVPPVYRSRLDPNRTSLAQRGGASLASEQAVERALDWLARHQDLADGRWDGGTARYKDGTAVEDDDSFTIHCPAGEVCSGECFYWEADTALTGLSLLAYLGAGYTHVDGKYASTVGKGIEFLLRSQKADGDLRGPSQAVGMYCHSMATLALCEAYALTLDARLRDPVERAVAFLVRARSRDGLAWRYRPGAADSDTSILGWAVMALKSAKTVGIPIPPDTQAGMFDWLKKVSAGREGGLAFYSFEPKGRNVTPTMTAEAWACRQFLEVGGPGRPSDEAAAFLLRNPSDRGDYNVYYLYYGTLAMYQHGGDAWSTWNGRVRDQVVARQHTSGHKAGSWDPDDSPYGTHGGRIYGTALATLTLEVYYRFLRLYEPSTTAGPGAPGIRRPAPRAEGAAEAGPEGFRGVQSATTTGPGAVRGR